MNDTEKHECEQHLGTSEGVTMEDYFNHVSPILGMDIDTFKIEFKKFYSDITDWSF
jgi:hypothetical protein